MRHFDVAVGVDATQRRVVKIRRQLEMSRKPVPGVAVFRVQSSTWVKRTGMMINPIYFSPDRISEQTLRLNTNRSFKLSLLWFINLHRRKINWATFVIVLSLVTNLEDSSLFIAGGLLLSLWRWLRDLSVKLVTFSRAGSSISMLNSGHSTYSLLVAALVQDVGHSVSQCNRQLEYDQYVNFPSTKIAFN